MKVYNKFWTVFFISLSLLSCNSNKETDQHDKLDQSDIVNKSVSKDSMFLFIEDTNLNSEDVSYSLYQIFKNNPDSIFYNIDLVEKKLKHWKISMWEIICDEILKQSDIDSKKIAMEKMEEVFKEFLSKDSINNKAIPNMKSKILECIKESSNESDPNLIDY